MQILEAIARKPRSSSDLAKRKLLQSADKSKADKTKQEAKPVEKKAQNDQLQSQKMKTLQRLGLFSGANSSK